MTESAHRAFKSLDLDNYGRLLRRVINPALGFVLYDGDNMLIAATKGLLEGAERRMLERLPDGKGKAASFRCIELDDGSRLFTIGLVPDKSGVAPTLAAYVSSSGITAAAAMDGEMLDVLNPLLVCMRNDLQQKIEFDAMTGELTERYEELNLVYHTEDQVSLFCEGQLALNNLVENCVDYLNVDLAILCLREKKVVVHHQSQRPIADVTRMLRLAEGLLYDQIVSSGEALVINEPSDLPAGLRRGLPYKLLINPVADAAGEVDGVLILINSPARSSFANSDRNLLSVMAKKAARIVQSSYDPLTNLLNRESFEHFLFDILQSDRKSEPGQCVLHIGVDKLRVINDTKGHDAGDFALRLITTTVRECLCDTDVFARIGGDEFGVLLPNCSISRGVSVAEKIREAVSAADMEWHGQRMEASISIGVVDASGGWTDYESLLAAADVACDVAKEHGRNRVQVYQSEDETLVRCEQHMHMVGEVNAALRENRFRLYGQAIVAMTGSASETHFEILLRMHDHSGNLILPGQFLPAAERYQIMTEVDRWVVKNSFDIVSAFGSELDSEEMLYSINLSGQSFSDPSFVHFVLSELLESGLDPGTICFEITETAAVANLSSAVAFMDALKLRGCKFSLDDFGSGLSSFSYLKAFPVDYLKIDGALIRDIATDPVAEAMVSAINEVGHIMGLKTIAEFVENQSIKARLQRIGVDYAQGYAIHKPQNLVEVLESLKRQTQANAQ